MHSPWLVLFGVVASCREESISGAGLTSAGGSLIDLCISSLSDSL